MRINFLDIIAAPRSVPKQDSRPRPPHRAVEEEEKADDSGSDYDGEWGEDDWGETEVRSHTGDLSRLLYRSFCCLSQMALMEPSS